MRSRFSFRRLTRPMLVLMLPAAAFLLGAAASLELTPVVAVLDADRVQRESTTIQKELLSLSTPAQSLQDQLEAKKKELKAMLEQYQAQESAATEEANTQRREKIEAMTAEARDLARQFDEALIQAGGSGLEPIRKRIFQTVESLARQRGIEMVISTNNVIYNAAHTDITDAVIARLDTGADQP